MRKLYTILSLTLLGSVAIAQPTITEVNMPLLGDVLTRGICSDVPNATTLNSETGVNYSWDFSTLTELSTGTFNFIDPSNSYWPTDFASSTYVGEEPDEDAYSAYTVSNAALEANGFRVITAPGDTSEINYVDSEVILNFPATYGNSNADNFSGNGVAGSFNFSISGSLNYTIDGYGTLELPNGSYQNVIRYHADRSEVFTISGFPPNTATKEQWIWVSSDYRFWLLLMEVITDPLNGNSTTVWYQKTPMAVNPTGIADLGNEGLTIYPNPVASNGVIQLSRALDANESAEILDLHGRVVRTYNTATAAVSLDGVSSGVYLFRVTDRDGSAISTQKLIVQ